MKLILYSKDLWVKKIEQANERTVNLAFSWLFSLEKSREKKKKNEKLKDFKKSNADTYTKEVRKIITSLFDKNENSTSAIFFQLIQLK